jgi:hypothetical protein
MGRGGEKSKFALEEVERFSIPDLLDEFAPGPLETAKSLALIITELQRAATFDKAIQRLTLMAEQVTASRSHPDLEEERVRLFKIALGSALDPDSDLAVEEKVVRALKVTRLEKGFTSLVARDPDAFKFYHAMAKEGDSIAICGRPIHDHFERGATYEAIAQNTICGECRNRSGFNTREVVPVVPSLFQAFRNKGMNRARELFFSHQEMMSEAIKEVLVENPEELWQSLREKAKETFALTLAKEVSDNFIFVPPGEETPWREVLSVYPTKEAEKGPKSTQVIADALCKIAGVPNFPGSEEMKLCVYSAWTKALEGETTSSLNLDDRYIAHLSASLVPKEIGEIAEISGADIPLEILYIWEKEYPELMNRSEGVRGIALLARVLERTQSERPKSYEDLKISISELIPLLKDPSLADTREILLTLQAQGFLTPGVKGSFKLHL